MATTTKKLYKTIMTTRPPEGIADKHYVGVVISHPEGEPTKLGAAVMGFKGNSFVPVGNADECRIVARRLMHAADVMEQGTRPTIADVAKPIVDTLRAIGQTDADILRMAFPAVKWDTPTVNPEAEGFRVL